ncbi:hypothetical protein FKP32DRAFT_133809 [Trametes sanguinea]|nr:hypothetical protein FKP32DRAFT_133809 [Trametes sanguinea]
MVRISDMSEERLGLLYGLMFDCIGVVGFFLRLSSLLCTSIFHRARRDPITTIAKIGSMTTNVRHPKRADARFAREPPPAEDRIRPHSECPAVAVSC